MKRRKQTETAFHEMGMDYYLRRTQEVLERVEIKSPAKRIMGATRNGWPFILLAHPHDVFL
jgi:hypothetical protein